MDLAYTSSKTGTDIKVNGKMTSNKAKADTLTQTDQYTKAYGRMTRSTDLEYHTAYLAKSNKFGKMVSC
jgi:hypothetical protein